MFIARFGCATTCLVGMLVVPAWYAIPVDTYQRLQDNSGLAFLEGFPSGQRDQTVNLTAQPSEVQILPPPPCGFTSGISGEDAEPKEVHNNIAGSDFERRARRGGPEGAGQDARSQSSPLHHSCGKDGCRLADCYREVVYTEG